MPHAMEKVPFGLGGNPARFSICGKNIFANPIGALRPAFPGKLSVTLVVVSAGKLNSPPVAGISTTLEPCAELMRI